MVRVMKNVNNVDARKSTALLYYIANKLFGHQWLFERVKQINTNVLKQIMIVKNYLL